MSNLTTIKLECEKAFGKIVSQKTFPREPRVRQLDGLQWGKPTYYKSHIRYYYVAKNNGKIYSFLLSFDIINKEWYCTMS
jgi:hypothetical protein